MPTVSDDLHRRARAAERPRTRVHRSIRPRWEVPRRVRGERLQTRARESRFCSKTPFRIAPCRVIEVWPRRSMKKVNGLLGLPPLAGEPCLQAPAGICPLGGPDELLSGGPTMTRAGLLHFREVPSPGNASPGPTRTMATRGLPSRRERPTRYGQATLFVVGIWLLGLVGAWRCARVRAASRRDATGAGRDRADAEPAGGADPGCLRSGGRRHERCPGARRDEDPAGRGQEGVDGLGRDARESRPQRRAGTDRAC